MLSYARSRFRSSRPGSFRFARGIFESCIHRTKLHSSSDSIHREVSSFQIQRFIEKSKLSTYCFRHSTAIPLPSLIARGKEIRKMRRFAKIRTIQLPWHFHRNNLACSLVFTSDRQNGDRSKACPRVTRMCTWTEQSAESELYIASFLRRELSSFHQRTFRRSPDSIRSFLCFLSRVTSRQTFPDSR